MPHERVIPWWMGYFLASPFRRLLQDPQRLIAPFVKENMTVAEIGPGMGFFTIPIARAIGPGGRVFAVDIQKQMLDHLAKRAKRAGVGDRIECRLCASDSLMISDLKDSIDFVLAIAVIHEIPDRFHALKEIFTALKAGGTMLMADPMSRFSEEELGETVEFAKGLGFSIGPAPHVRQSRTCLLVKPA